MRPSKSSDEGEEKTRNQASHSHGDRHPSLQPCGTSLTQVDVAVNGEASMKRRAVILVQC